MNATELRIGNWVLFAPTGKKRKPIPPRPCQVKEIQPKQITVIDKAVELTLWPGTNELQPIPLTPEVLEKAGFVLNGLKEWELEISSALPGPSKRLWFSGDQLYLEEWDGVDFTTMSVVAIWNKKLIKDFYLHQLQNLYFALTGQELNINL